MKFLEKLQAIGRALRPAPKAKAIAWADVPPPQTAEDQLKVGAEWAEPVLGENVYVFWRYDMHPYVQGGPGVRTESGYTVTMSEGTMPVQVEEVLATRSMEQGQETMLLLHVEMTRLRDDIRLVREASNERIRVMLPELGGAQ